MQFLRTIKDLLAWLQAAVTVIDVNVLRLIQENVMQCTAVYLEMNWGYFEHQLQLWGTYGLYQIIKPWVPCYLLTAFVLNLNWELSSGFCFLSSTRALHAKSALSPSNHLFSIHSLKFCKKLLDQLEEYSCNFYLVSSETPLKEAFDSSGRISIIRTCSY